MTALIETTKLVLNIIWLGLVIACACTYAAASTATTRVASATTNAFTSLRSRFTRTA